MMKLHSDQLHNSLVACALLFACSTVQSAPTFRLETTSEQGDFVGGGRPRTYTELDGAIVVNTTSRSTPGRVDFAEFSIQPSAPDFNRWFLLMVSTRELGYAIRNGTYLNAERASFASAGRPGLDVTQDGAGCNTISGSFEVLDVRISPTNDLEFLDMTFVQRCDNGTGLLRGRFAYDASGAVISFASTAQPVPTFSLWSLLILMSTLTLIGLRSVGKRGGL